MGGAGDGQVHPIFTLPVTTATASHSVEAVFRLGQWRWVGVGSGKEVEVRGIPYSHTSQLPLYHAPEWTEHHHS